MLVILSHRVIDIDSSTKRFRLFARCKGSSFWLIHWFILSYKLSSQQIPKNWIQMFYFDSFYKLLHWTVTVVYCTNNKGTDFHVSIIVMLLLMLFSRIVMLTEYNLWYGVITAAVQSHGDADGVLFGQRLHDGVPGPGGAASHVPQWSRVALR